MSHTAPLPSPLSRFGQVSFLALCLLGANACSDMSVMQQRVLSGGAIGTTVGVVGTAMTGGCIACGAAIGGAVGAGSGYLYDYVDRRGW